jgi:hypothetical protein
MLKFLEKSSPFKNVSCSKTCPNGVAVQRKRSTGACPVKETFDAVQKNA